MYEVELQEGFIKDLRTNPEGNLGRVSHTLKVIQTDPEIIGFFEIILHECVHTLDYKLNLGFDEDTVQRLSEGLYCLLTDNNWLIEDLEEKIRKKCKYQIKELEKEIVEEVSTTLLKRENETN